MALIVEQIVILKLLNGLSSFFSTYLTILNKQARRDKKFPKLDDLLKNLEDEEARMRQDSIAVANLVFKNKKNQATTEPAKEREQCYQCKKWHRGECRFAESRYYTYNEIGHISQICTNSLTSTKEKMETRRTIACVLTQSPITENGKVLTINSRKAQNPTRDTFLDFATSEHSICNKDLFIPGTYRKHRHFLETGSEEVLLSEGWGSVLASLDYGKENHIISPFQTGATCHL